MDIKSGIIVVDKPVGYTSRDIVNIASKHLKTKKIGHTGTLDPNASGVLVLCVGSALKLVSDITSSYKEYVCDAIIGTLTDTLDMDGKIINTCNTIITLDMVRNVLDSFAKSYLQEVPLYSAVKVDGRRLYDYARSGEDVVLPRRKVNILSLELLSDVTRDGNNYLFSFKCTVSKGCYIRSLVRDIGEKLNSYGTVKSLRRTKQGDFDISCANSLDDIKSLSYNMFSIKEVLDIGKIHVSDELLFKIKNGCILKKFFDGDKVLVLDSNDKEVAIYELFRDDLVKVYKMF